MLSLPFSNKYGKTTFYKKLKMVHFCSIVASMPWDFKHHPHFSRPKDDNGYLEAMSRIVFSAGLNWSVVDKKWPAITKGFDNFVVSKVATFNEDAIYKLVNDPNMIRSGGKITAIVKNAQAVQEVENEFGSMRKYFEKMKKEGIETLLKDIQKRFAYMGKSTSVMLLFGVGEETPELFELMEKSHGK